MTRSIGWRRASRTQERRNRSLWDGWMDRSSAAVAKKQKGMTPSSLIWVGPPPGAWSVSGAVEHSIVPSFLASGRGASSRRSSRGIISDLRRAAEEEAAERSKAAKTKQRGKSNGRKKKAWLSGDRCRCVCVMAIITYCTEKSYKTKWSRILVK
ncbi:hypothetical protein ABW21_db0208988 [Orbilia brochopaga]|nr:hypothetical protein ABW21_db0208988 [Drechslerella brochopaga]